MINTLHIYEELSQALDPKAAQKLASVLGSLYEDLQQTVTKAEFTELRQVVLELAQAQKRTEQRVEELAEAQKRTEQRVEELSEVQKRTEERLEQLTRRVDALAEAQQRTETRLAELALRVDQLAVAQKRTEEALTQLALRVDHLAERLDDTNKQLGGLTATVGYTLENQAYRALPPLLERDHGLVLREPLRRGWLRDAEGRPIEVNILGQGSRGAQSLWIIGESKVQLSARDVDRFLQRRVETLRPVLGEIFPVVVAHMVTGPDVEAYARDRGVAVYLSYQFPNGAEPTS